MRQTSTARRRAQLSVAAGGVIVTLVVTVALIAWSDHSPGTGVPDGTVAAGAVASVSAEVGQLADYTAWVRNDGEQTVTLRSARLRAFAPFPAPSQGDRLAVETGRLTALATRGWPPLNSRAIGLKRFVGYRVAPHRTVRVLFTVYATRPGDYATKGLEITASVGGAVQEVDALAGGATCVYPRPSTTPCARRFLARVQGAVDVEVRP